MVKKLILADAFLGDDGCIVIANALKSNGSIVHLDLRGNNIRSDGASALSQMLKVNTVLKRVCLEWNCIGIWESGIRSLADALTINQSLEELDLRNNKIGPQGVCSLAISLKHNTTLRKLDLRWNNAGIVGGRALVDTLKWNNVIMDMDLTGNEIPDDISKTIAVGLERNRERHTHDYHAKLHSEHLATTLQTITSSHKEAIDQLANRLHSTDAEAANLSTRLAGTFKELAEVGETKRVLEAKVERLEKELSSLQDTLVQEREQSRTKYAELQRESVSERERGISQLESHQRAISDHTTRNLELEALLRETQMKLEVLKRDKSLLLEEMDKARDREKSLNHLMEERLQRQENTHKDKLAAALQERDREFNEKKNKLEDKIQLLEHENTRVEQEFNSEKLKFSTQKRNLEEKINETEIRLRKEEEQRRKDIENQLDSMRHQRDQLQQTLETQMHQYHKAILDHEIECKRLQDSKSNLTEQLAELKTSFSQVQSECSNLRARVDELKKEKKEGEFQVERLSTDMTKYQTESGRKELDMRKLIDELKSQLSMRDSLITKLKDDLKRKDDELDEQENENTLRMKELQLSINSLLSARSRKTRSPSRVTTFDS